MCEGKVFCGDLTLVEALVCGFELSRESRYLITSSTSRLLVTEDEQ